MSAPDDLTQALQELPLFPLQEVVLFPTTLLPLHVFEPRYVQLVRDVMKSHRSLSVVYVPDREADMAHAPAIAPIAGIGTIVEYSELPGERYHIVVLGRARVKLQELSFLPPYRRALATLLPPTGAVPDVELAAMHAAVTAFIQVVRKHERDLKLRLPKDAPAGVLADALAHQLVLDVRERQLLLETLDVRERVRRLTEILTVQRAALAPAHGPTN